MSDWVDSQIPRWRLFERMAAVLVAQNLEAGIEVTTTMNATLVGAYSQVARQIDLLVEARWQDDRSRRIIVDAKHYKRRLTVKEVEAFEGMMRDCRAPHGILVCPSGWSKGAERRAKDSISLRLLTLDDALERTDWAIIAECAGCLLDVPDPQRRGIVMWNGQHLLVHLGVFVILYTGKCDTCHKFQVWCWDCGEVFALATGESYHCWCERNWSTSIIAESTDVTRESMPGVYLTLTIDGTTTAVDRISVS